MSSYHGWTHAPKAQGGTDPIPGIVGNFTSAVILNGYESINAGDDEINDDTWEYVGLSAGTRYWQEGQMSDEDWNVNLDTGVVRRDDFAFYVCYGSVGFPDVTGGEVIGVSVTFKNDNDFMYTNAFEIPTPATIPFFRVTVAASWWGDLDLSNTHGARMQVYQKSGGPQALGRVTFMVRRFEILDPSNTAVYFEHE